MLPLMAHGGRFGVVLAGLASSVLACAYEEPIGPAPLSTLAQWPAGVAGATSGIHAVVAVAGDTQLAPYATLALDNVVIDIEGDLLRLGFVLPPGLLGYEVPYVLEGGRQGDLVMLQSAEADVLATCEFGATLFCDVQYGPVAVDEGALEAYWVQEDPQATAAHLHVGQAFAASPQGTMDILLQR